MIDKRLFPICEALLFASPEPLSADVIGEILRQEGLRLDRDVSNDLESFRSWINDREGGLMVIRVAGGWQLVTRPEAADAVTRLKTHRQNTRFSRAALEVLAIIAYRQPITTPEIEAIRGVDSAGVLKNLMQKKMITLLGRKKFPGNPLLYGTTRLFLKTFGLDSLDALPDLTEFTALFPPGMMQSELPFGKQTEYPAGDLLDRNNRLTDEGEGIV
ncbi:SMC-Scp complex subunit ScpB [bacterium]|nr:SMC-Scp complex subunit ScpB [candidate division CSSED10-310 bacterium]